MILSFVAWTYGCLLSLSTVSGSRESDSRILMMRPNRPCPCYRQCMLETIPSMQQHVSMLVDLPQRILASSNDNHNSLINSESALNKMLFEHHQQSSIDYPSDQHSKIGILFTLRGGSQAEGEKEDVTMINETNKQNGVSGKQRGGWFTRRGTKVSQEDTKDQKSDETNSTPAKNTNTEVQSGSSNATTTTPNEDNDVNNNSTESNVNTTTASSTTVSANTAANTTLQQPNRPSIGPSTIMLLPPPGSYRYHHSRRSAASSTNPISLQPPGSPGQGPNLPSPMQQPNGVILLEVATSVLGTVTRLWFLTWLTRRIAAQEESIHPTQHFVWERLDDRYVRDEAALKTALSTPPSGIHVNKWKRQHVRKVLGRPSAPIRDLSKMFTRTVVVVELNSEGGGGSRGSGGGGLDLQYLSDIITFIIRQYRRNAFGIHRSSGQPMDVEVVFLVQSPGGSVATFGLAAAQLNRLRQEHPGLSITVCVDKYAASGGYMMACTAHQLIASPFASVGSIGVIMEGLNFHELAQRYGITPIVVKSGDSKNPISTFGQVTKDDIKMEQERLNKVHVAFQQLVVEGRPALVDKLNIIAQGSVFLGKEALDLDLVDRVMTSDEYILERIEKGDRVLQLHRSRQGRFAHRLGFEPHEILPHLKHQKRNWMTLITSKLFKTNAASEDEHDLDLSVLLTRLVQVGSLLSVLYDVFLQYSANR